MSTETPMEINSSSSSSSSSLSIPFSFSSSSTMNTMNTMNTIRFNRLKRSRSQDNLKIESTYPFDINNQNHQNHNHNHKQSFSPISDSECSDDDQHQLFSKRRNVETTDSSTTNNHGGKFDVEAIAQELNCGICLELVHRPTTIVHCLHTFCWKCIHSHLRPETPTKVSQVCPTCLSSVTLSKPNPALDSLKEVLLKFDPSRERPLLEIEDADDEFQSWKLRNGTGEIRPTPIRYDEDQYQDEDDGFIYVSRRTANPNLNWPCPTCLPGNHSGYLCSNPISAPTPDQLTVNDYAPSRGDQWPELTEALSNHHSQCSSCSSWVPRYGPKSSYCATCLVYSCEPFSPRGCPIPDSETTLTLLHESLFDNDCSVSNLISNWSLTGFTPNGENLNEFEKNRLSQMLEELMDYVEDKGTCLHEISSDLFKIAKQRLEVEKEEKALEVSTNETLTIPVEPVTAIESGNTDGAVNPSNSSPNEAGEEIPAAVAAGVSEEASVIPELVKLIPSRNEEGRKLPHEIKGKVAEAIVESYFCSECSCMTLSNLVFAWWKEESKKLPPKRKSCGLVDLYSGDLLYSPITDDADEDE